MEKFRVVNGTKFQFDLQDLAIIAKRDNDYDYAIVLSYKQGLDKMITFKLEQERDNNYKQICQLHDDYLK